MTKENCDVKITNWGDFNERIYVETEIENLYSFWVTSEGIESFFMNEAKYIRTDGIIRQHQESTRPGDTYQWEFHTGKRVTGTVLRVIENKIFEFTFGEVDKESGEYIYVLVEFGYIKGNSWIDLTQFNMRNTFEHKVMYNISCNVGWMFHLNNLKSVIEKDHDLRNMIDNRMHIDAPSGRPLNEFRWDTFQLTEFYNSLIEDVFKNLVTIEGLENFFLKKALVTYHDKSGDKQERQPQEIFQSGDSYYWEWFDGYKMSGDVLEVEELNKFIFSFGPKARVAIEFEQLQNICKVTLTQYQIPTTEIGKYQWNRGGYLGWGFYLMNLRSIIENNNDLRIKTEFLLNHKNRNRK